VLHQHLGGEHLLGRVAHLAGAAEDDGRAVVHAVVEDRPGEHERVEQGHCEADVGALPGPTKHPRRRRAVDVEGLADAGVHRRDDVRTPSSTKPRWQTSPSSRMDRSVSRS
jgi:hypothetical protein